MSFEHEATGRPAGFGPADLHNVFSGRTAAKEVVETDYPMHFGAGKVQQLRYARHHLSRNESKGCLSCVENRQQGARLIS